MARKVVTLPVQVRHVEYDSGALVLPGLVSGDLASTLDKKSSLISDTVQLCTNLTLSRGHPLEDCVVHFAPRQLVFIPQ